MAVITPSSLISEIRGSVGDVTYSRNRYGAYVKAKLIQPASATALQVIRRAALTAGVLAWQNMSELEHSKWDKFVANNTVTKQISRRIRRAAYNELISRYCNRSILGASETGFHAYPRVRMFPLISGVTLDLGEINVAYKSRFLKSDCDYVIYVTPPLSNGITSPNLSAYHVLESFTPLATTGVQNIFTSYDAAHPLTSADIGKKIFIQICAINSDNFAASTKQSFEFTITAALLAAPPQVVTTRTIRFGNLTSITCNFSVAPADGNLILIMIRTQGTVTVTPAAGFAFLTGPTGVNPQYRIFYKIAASDGPNFTFTLSASAVNTEIIGYIIKDNDTGTIFGNTGVNSSLSTGVSTLAAAAAFDVALNSLVITWLVTGGGVTNTPALTNSFGNIIEIGSGGNFSIASGRRAYPVAALAQNSTWSWITNGRARVFYVEILALP